MRDLLVLLFFIASLPVSFRNPVHGVLLYALVSYLNPQRLTWGFAFNLPIAFGIAVATLMGIALYKGDRRLPLSREVCLIIALWVLASLGWFIALSPEGFREEWERFTKILIMILATVSLVKTRRDLRLLYWVIALSIGFYILKGAVWGVLGGAQSGGLMWGPEGTFFADNNAMGMVVNMVWPLLFFMPRHENNKWARLLLQGLFWVSPLTVVLTRSRGAAVAMCVTGIFLFRVIKNKMAFAVVALLALLIMLPMVPGAWFDRMHTISNYEEDSSAMGRINMWRAGWNLALDRPLTGGGLSAFTSPETAVRYAPDPENFHDIHSVYFEVLGEMGFPGLAVFVMLLVLVVMRLHRVRVNSVILSEGQFYADYADAVRLGIIAYMVNGVFLKMACFDLFYQYVGMAMSLMVLQNEELRQLSDDVEISVQVDYESQTAVSAQE
jgi:probable O-glycosylation ligase (exosortase A-associated)